jgi:signal transduction histidine kinase
VNEELAWQNARIQSELWIDQKSLALTLHNDVQASLLAAALKLKAAFDKGDDLANQTLPEIRELISRSINFGSAQSRNRTLSDAVRRINDTWAGIITLDVTASQDATSALERDVVGLGVLEDVLSEFQNNSLKHGKATEITAALSMPENDVLHVVLTNNGQPLRQDFHSGLGSAFMKSVALKYALENIDGGVQLVLLLPLSPTTSTS